MPDPNSRPDFQQIASRFDDILPDDKDPRPLVRIKAKKVSRLSIAAPKEVVASTGSDRFDAPKQHEGFHSTYRGKFKNRSLEAAASPRFGATMTTSTTAGTVIAAEDAVMGDDISAGSNRSNNFMDSFADVFLATFTPGKEPGVDANEEKKDDDDDDFV